MCRQGGTELADYRGYVQQLNQISSLANSSDLPPIIIFFGENDYFLSRSAKFYRSHWQEICSGEVLQHEVESFSQELKDGSFHQSSLFSTTTLHCFSTSEVKQVGAILDVAGSADSDSYFCIQFKKADLPKTASSKLGKGMALACCAPTRNELPGFIQALARRYSVSLDSSAIDLVIEQVGEDFASIENELTKIALVFAERGAQKVSANDIAPVLGILREDHAFKLSDLIIENRHAEATALISELIERGESPLAVLGLLSRHTRLLAQFMNGPSQTQSRLPSWLKAKYERIARKYTTQSIKSLFNSLAKIDLQLKSSSVDERMLLSAYVLELR